jgi:uncharacterized protein (DUF433 family)
VENRITSDPDILGGKPCVRGTRLSVEFILELIAAGASAGQIVEAYPQLTPDDVEAAVLYAASSLRNDALLELKVLG